MYWNKRLWRIYAPNNSFDIVSGAKEYSDHKGTTLIGTVQKEDEQDEDSLLEVAW